MASCMPESKEEIYEESCYSSDVSEDYQYKEEDAQFYATQSQRPAHQCKEEDAQFYAAQSPKPSHERQGSYDSEECAKHDFALSNEELDKCLRILHTSKAKKNSPYKDTCLTHTSHWRRKASTASAAYKIFKVKRWLLKNVSVVFDPFNEDTRKPVTVKRSSILWPDLQGADDEVVILKGLSVDGLLANKCDDVAMKNLKKLDEALKEFDQDTPVVTSDNAQELLHNFLHKGTKIIPRTARQPFKDLAYILIRAINICSKGDRADEIFFQNMFESLFRCVMVCIKEEERVQVSQSLDGGKLDKLELRPISQNPEKNLIVSSKPDLFIFERGADDTTKRIIAVVEVKGKARDQVLHSDDEEEPPSLGFIDEESEEELSILEKLKTKKKPYMKRLDRDSRRYTRSFLPQLFGEMLCCSVTNGFNKIKTNDFGSTLGIAVVGFDVYFVTVVSSRNTVFEMLIASESYTNIFITRPFNLCKRRDRQIVFKVLSAACYVNKPLIWSLGNVSSDGLETLDLDKLQITTL